MESMKAKYVFCDLVKNSSIVLPLILKTMEQKIIDTNNLIMNFKVKSILCVKSHTHKYLE